MLALFRTNQAYASLLLFGYALLLQLPAFFVGGGAQVQSIAEGQSYLGQQLTDMVDGSRLLSILLPPLLVALAGIAANNLCDRYRMARTVSQFPGMVLVLLWGLSPAFHTFDPAQLNHLLLVLAAIALGSTYKSKSPEVGRFNAGFWLGVASLLEPAYLLLVLAFIVGISIFRTADLRSMAQLLVGVGIAYFLAGTYAYMAGDLGAFWAGQRGGFGLRHIVAARRFAAVGTLLLLLPLLLVLATTTRGRMLLSIEGAKNVSFIHWLLLFSLPVAFLAGATGLAQAQVVVAPLGILTGLWLVRQPEAQAEFYHLLFFVAALTLYTLSLIN